MNEGKFMTSEELHEFAQRRPFEPFRVILTTGEAHDVQHPDLIMVGRRSAIIGIARDPARSVYARTVKVDLLHVVGVEDLPSQPRPDGSNGEKRD
jgi:hypothetical protein